MTSSESRFATQPRLRANDWGPLTPATLGDWVPSLSVSVVIPAYDAGLLLPTVLAGLAAQTYPDHLLEVVVVNDGPGPLALPEVRPERTRIIDVTEGWGRANACHTGALASDGDVLHWLDSDMLAERDEVEAQLRWHHLVDYAVVLGHKWFVDPASVLAADPADVRDAVAANRVADYFTGQDLMPHDWVEAVFARTDDLRAAGPRALRTHVGATGSLHRWLYTASGGMDTSLRLGEDIDLGYRLAEAGAVILPDRDASSWHLGFTHVMTQRDQVNAHNDPYLADRIPDLRPKRRPGRLYSVPYLDVVLDTRGESHERVSTVVDAVLASTLGDLVVTLLGDWSELGEGRRSPLADPLLDARLIQASYVGDPRVRFLPAVPDGRCEAMFRLTLGDAGWAPRPTTLASMLMHLERTHHGLRQVMQPDGTSTRLERTAAVERARHLVSVEEDLDAVIDEVYGGWWVEGLDAGWMDVTEVPRPRLPNTAGPALSPDRAWEALGQPSKQLPATSVRPAPVGQPVNPPVNPPVTSAGEPHEPGRRRGGFLRRGSP